MVLLWHQRLAHASLPVVRYFLSTLKPNFNFTGITNIDFCDVCVRTKLTHKVFDKIRVRPTRPAEVIAADIIGPISPATVSTGFKFILTVIDVYTKYARVFVLRKKNETGQYIKVFFDMARAQFPGQGQIKTLCTDNGTEFTSEAVKKLLREYGVDHKLSEPDISAHNGVIERFNRTLEVKTRSILAESGFPSTFWGLAVGAAEYLYNRTPHSAIDFDIPYTRWMGVPPTIDNIAVFGSVVYQLQKGVPQGRKFAETSRLSFLVGYTDSGYFVYDPQTCKTTMACNVKIDESRLYRHIYPTSAGELQWEIRVRETTKRGQSEADHDHSVVTADVHAPAEGDTQRMQIAQPFESELLCPQPPHTGTIRQNDNTDRHFTNKDRKYKVTVTDAPDTDSEETHWSDSDMSSDEQEEQLHSPRTQPSQISYRSVELSDCSLPLIDEGTQALQQETADFKEEVQVHVTTGGGGEIHRRKV